ncbi:MAG TPA: hypothetical protein VGK46_13595 [Saprospiraceae bacterium]
MIQCYPFNSQLKWVDKRKTGYRFYQRTLETKLILKDDPKNGITDFTSLFNLERQGLTCTKVPISIDKYCDCDESWTTGFYNGYIRLNACDWNVSECTVDVPIVVQDPYTCMTTSWESKVNMFDYGDPVVTTSPFYGVLQYIQCEDTHEISWQPPVPISQQKAACLDYFTSNNVDNCIDPLNGWTTKKKTFVADQQLDLNEGLFDGPPEVTMAMTLRQEYVREFSADVSMPPGPGWLAVTGGWARTVNVISGPEMTSETPEGLQALVDEWGSGYDIDFGLIFTNNIIGMDNAGNSNLSNGKELGPLVESLLEPCGITVISNFYNINPDGTNPDNEYYDNAAVDFSAIVLYQITDIARLDESQSATGAAITLKGLLDAMKIAGNCDIQLDGTVLRIEHLSYWPTTVNIDLTQSEFLYLIEDKWKYTYDEQSQPKEEKIGWDSETDGYGNDFDGYPIEYFNDCVNEVENKQPRVLLANGYLTNIRFIAGNEDYYDTTDIIVMVSTTNLIVNSATQPISGNYVLNGNLAMGYLLPRYYDYGRPFKIGHINQVSTPMYSLFRLRLQAPITIPFSCDNYLNEFDPAGLVKTQLGACEIETATYTDPDATMEFKLRGK